MQMGPENGVPGLIEFAHAHATSQTDQANIPTTTTTSVFVFVDSSSSSCSFSQLNFSFIHTHTHTDQTYSHRFAQLTLVPCLPLPSPHTLSKLQCSSLSPKKSVCLKLKKLPKNTREKKSKNVKLDVFPPFPFTLMLLIFIIQ